MQVLEHSSIVFWVLDRADETEKSLIMGMQKEKLNLTFHRKDKFVVRQNVLEYAYQESEYSKEMYSVTFFTSDSSDKFDIKKKDWDQFLVDHVDKKQENQKRICKQCRPYYALPKWIQKLYPRHPNQAGYIILSRTNSWNKLPGVKRYIFPNEKYCKLTIQVHNDPEKKIYFDHKKPGMIQMEFLQMQIKDKIKFIIFFQVFCGFFNVEDDQYSNFLTSGFFELKNYVKGVQRDTKASPPDNINYDLEMSAEPNYTLIFDKDFSQDWLPLNVSQRRVHFSEIIEEFLTVQNLKRKDFPHMPNIL